MKKQLFILLFLPMIGVGQISDNPEYKDLNSINIDMWKNFNIDSVELDIDNIKFKNKRYYSNSSAPLLFREGPNINSKVLNRIKYGEELTVTDGPLTKHDLTFNFSTNFKANYKNISYNTHTIQSYYVEA